MRDFISLGPVPCNEPCAQLGTAIYDARRRIENQVFRNQLETEFPAAVFGCKAFPHDFGTYHELVVYFETDDAEATDFALHVETEASSEWSLTSLRLLKEQGYAQYLEPNEIEYFKDEHRFDMAP
jgi:hypothetical protein